MANYCKVIVAAFSGIPRQAGQLHYPPLPNCGHWGDNPDPVKYEIKFRNLHAEASRRRGARMGLVQ